MAQLKTLEVEMSETFLVHYILNTLSQVYEPFKISYNTHMDKWSINELLNMCVQEEGIVIMEIGESAHVTTQGKITTHESNPTSFVCYKSNMIDVNQNTWWIDSSSLILVLQFTLRTPCKYWKT